DPSSRDVAPEVCSRQWTAEGTAQLLLSPISRRRDRRQAADLRQCLPPLAHRTRGAERHFTLQLADGIHQHLRWRRQLLGRPLRSENVALRVSEVQWVSLILRSNWRCQTTRPCASPCGGRCT